ncbi:hypothetical protein THIX_30468 [Thiomonas sp. X19]|nr:hypothetical protein THIX_30468 [Thiomonas sp. X19]
MRGFQPWIAARPTPAPTALDPLLLEQVLEVLAGVLTTRDALLCVKQRIASVRSPGFVVESR